MTENIQKLTQKLLFEKEIKIANKTRKVIGMARYATLNSPNDEYIKVSFSDGGGMYYLLNEDVAFAFDSKLHVLDGIDITVIGKATELNLNGTIYRLVNGNDYQFVKQFYIGTIRELEGEVQFSDYEDSEGNTLSLGITMIDGKRADVLARPIEIAQLLD